MGDQIYVHWSDDTVVLSCGFHTILETEDDIRRDALRQLEYVLIVDLEYDATVDGSNLVFFKSMRCLFSLRNEVPRTKTV